MAGCAVDASAGSEGLDPSDADRRERPRIGLALSGGGARGCAHIGVLQVLEEMRIPVDFVAGTSMGAVVGGLYASGQSAGEIEEHFLALDWTSIGDDEPPREERVFRRKEDDQRFLMNLEIGLDGFELPRGLRSGQRFTFELRRWTWPVALTRDFVDLPIPFTAVAVDLETGERVLIDRGNLADAMRASMSIPGVFTPVELDGRLLVDGGIRDNLPVDAARAMGADIVIAVDIGDELRSREELKSMLAVTSQAMTISSQGATEPQRHRADHLLLPEVSERGTLDFSDIPSLILEGRREALQHVDRLRSLALSETEWTQRRASAGPPSQAERHIVSVQFRGLERVDPRSLRAVMKTPLGEPLDFAILRRDLARIHGLGDFDRVDFGVQEEGDGLGLIISVRERAGGPFFFRHALNVDLDEDLNSRATISLNLTAKRLNALGAEWRTDLRIGSEQDLATELYQPLDFAGRWFAEARAYQREDRFIVGDGGSLSEIERVARGLRLDLGRVAGRFGEFRLGVFEERLELSGLHVRLKGWGAEFTMDRLDSIYFPRRGQLGAVAVSTARPDDAGEPFTLGSLNHVGATSLGRHTFLSWIELGSGLGDDPPPYAWFGGGGLFSFSGYQRGELFGASYAVFRPTYFFQIGTLPSVIGEGLYVGGWAEAGNFWPSRDDVDLEDLRYAATLIVGAETVLGPLYLGFGFAEEGRHQVYLSIGPSFSTRPR